MNNLKHILVFLFAFLLAAGPAVGAQLDNFYFGAEMGFVEQEDFDINGVDNDVPTRCDQVLYEQTVNNREESRVNFVDFSAANFVNLLQPGGACERGLDVFSSEADIDTGAFLGFQLGYRFNQNIRAEIEYMYRIHNEGDVENAFAGDSKDAELQVGEQGISGLSSHSSMVNVYWDFINESKYTPYIGFGAGASRMRLDYDATFARHAGPGNINSAPREAAATTTYGRNALRDTVFTWQLLAGVDYEIDANWAIGVKARYIEYEDVEDGHTWNRLRSHDSVVASPEYLAANPTVARALGDPAVRYEIEAEDIRAWAVGLGVRYMF